MEKLALVALGGVIAILSTIVAQWFIYRKELKFKRMEKIEELANELYKLSHSAHSLKIGNFEKTLNSVEDKKFFTLSMVYFNKSQNKIKCIRSLWMELPSSLMSKDKETFLSTLTKMDHEIELLILELKP